MIDEFIDEHRRNNKGSSKRELFETEKETKMKEYMSLKADYDQV